MIQILTKAGSFIFIILLGIFLRRIGFFKESDFQLISKITVRITLPASVIVSFAGREIDKSMLVLTLLPMGIGVLYMLLGYFLNINKSKERRAFEIMNLPGYNIGCVTMPFAQTFLGPIGVITTSLFDVGNACITLGTSYSIASMVKYGTGFSISRILKLLLHSVPFVFYITAALMSLLSIPTPAIVVEYASVIANANAFMAMLMIGVGFKLEGDRGQVAYIVRLLLIRYGIAAICSVIFYYYLPFSLEIRQALAILPFSPISVTVPGFTGELKEDAGLSSAINSLSIVISIIIIMILLTVLL